MIGVGIFTWGEEFWTTLTSYLHKEVISVVPTMLLYHMYGGWFADVWLGPGCWYLWLSAQVSFLHLGVNLLFCF